MKMSVQLVSPSARQQRGKKRSYHCIFLLFIFVGCVPAKVPPQLVATSGTAVVITEEEYDAGAFKVRYPAGWRIITSAATSPTAVIFASPDDSAIMMFGVDASEAPIPDISAQIRAESRQITLENGVIVTAVLNAPAEMWDTFIRLFDQSFESIN